MGAAFAGIYYLRKRNRPKIEDRLLVFYLWLVIFVEIVGIYPLVAYFTNYKFMPFIKGTCFERNLWWFNSYHIIKFAVFYFYFLLQLGSAKKKKFLSYLGVSFILALILYLIFSGEFFTQQSTLDAVGSTLLLMIIIFLYYFELLKSDKILNFYRSLPFYVSIGLLVWHLSLAPIFIYNAYFSTQSPNFVALHSFILNIANVVLYLSFILGFLICARSKNDAVKEVETAG